MTLDLTDEPINTPQQDKLGLNSIAEKLATSICKTNLPVGVAFGINGSWGMGKTSLINLVEHHLKGDVRKAKIKIVHFHCWWFNSEKALILHFLKTLFSSLDEGERKKGRKIFLSAVKSLAIATAAASTTGVSQFFLMGMLKSFFKEKENKSMDSLFQALSVQLAKSEKRYLVIIDDIDRLSAAEMTMMFRLVKTLGHLPNVVYLLAFDRAAAEKALSLSYPEAGPNFLEKIIQSSINIPLPKREVLDELVDNVVMEMVGYMTSFSIRSDQPDVRSVIRGICHAYIHTPRDFKRYKNALYITYPAVEKKIRLTDYLVMEALRIFDPKVHAYIESEYPWREETSLLYRKSSYYRPEDWSPFLDGLQEKISETRRDFIAPILDEMFPSKIKDIDELTTKQRIASPLYFRIYFYWPTQKEYEWRVRTTQRALERTRAYATEKRRNLTPTPTLPREQP